MRSVPSQRQHVVPAPADPATLNRDRAARLQAAVRAEVIQVETELATVREGMCRIAAGTSLERAVEAEPDTRPRAAQRPAPIDHPRHRTAAWIAATVAGLAVLTGTVASMGGAAAVADLLARPGDRPAVIAEAAARAAVAVTATPAFVPAASSDPGEVIYAARFAKVSVAEKMCLARAIYYEARGESFEGQVAVAQVVLNRARSQKWPATLCRVVYQGVERGEKCQFSFACMTHAEPSGVMWDEAQAIAEQAVAGHAWLREALEATYYHAASVAPVWRASLVVTGTIGSHVFYRDPKGLREAPAAKFAPAIAAVLPRPVHKVAAAAVRPAAVPAGASAAQSLPAHGSVTKEFETKTKVQASTQDRVGVQRKKAAADRSDSDWSANLLQPRF